MSLQKQLSQLHDSQLTNEAQLRELAPQRVKPAKAKSQGPRRSTQARVFRRQKEVYEKAIGVDMQRFR